MTWHLRIGNRAQRELERIPAKDRRRIIAALAAMRENPWSGDDVLTRLRLRPNVPHTPRFARR